jgi:hypothetical protein
LIENSLRLSKRAFFRNGLAGAFVISSLHKETKVSLEAMALKTDPSPPSHAFALRIVMKRINADAMKRMRITHFESRSDLANASNAMLNQPRSDSLVTHVRQAIGTLVNEEDHCDDHEPMNTAKMSGEVGSFLLSF